MTVRRIVAAFAASALIAVSQVAIAKTVVVRAAHLIDVIAQKRVDDAQIVIVDGRISAVGRKGDAIPSDAQVIDLGGRTLLPGLIDMHVHLTGDPRFSGYTILQFTDQFGTVIGVANARRTLEAGFTTVRNVGSDGFADVALRQAIDIGEIPGPRIVTATYALGATGGHCDTTELPPSLDRTWPNIANSPDEFRALVRKMHKYGAQVIKICATGGVLSKGDAVGAQQMTFEEMKAVADEAHMLGLRVAAHAHGTLGINVALRAGIDTIEHASLADAESFRLAREKGAAFDMDIYNDDYILSDGARNGVFPESLEKERVIGRKQRETFRAAHAAGVTMLFGTDGGVYPNGDNARQFARMVEWGMTPIEAITAATATAAKYLDRSGDVGAIAPGHYGDIIAVDGDPLADVRVLEHVAFVMKGGEVVKPVR